MLGILSTFIASRDENASDRACIDRLCGGDRSSVAELYDRHGARLYSVALRILSEEGEAEDVIQDVFVQVWRTAATYSPQRGSVVAWLLTITRSRAIDHLRARQARPPLASAAEQERANQISAPSVDPVTLFDTNVARRSVMAALKDLPALQRIAIELAYFDGLTQQEIADRLEQPLGSVKTRIRLGLSRLRDAIRDGQS